MAKRKPSTPSTTTADNTSLYSLYAPGPEWGFNQAVPVSQDPSKGYDVRATKLETTRQTQAINKSNGSLSDGQSFFSLFIQRLGMDMSLAGSYGQSQFTRDFYPRNFVQPSVVVVGQSLNQEDYGILCEFVHSAQHKAVAGGYTSLTQLFLIGRYTTNGFQGRGVDGTRTGTTKVKLSQPQLMTNRPADPRGAPAGEYYSQSIRGAHQRFAAKGYISSMPRKHQQFEYAVTWSMNFTIAAMLDGPFQDPHVGGLPNKAPVTWLDLPNDIKKSGVTTGTPALIKQNKKIVQYASSISINPLTPSTGGGSGSFTGNAQGSLGASTGNVTDIGQIVRGLSAAANSHGIPPLFVVTVWLSEGEVTGNSPNSAGARGYFQFTSANPYGFYPSGQPISYPSGASDLGIAANLFCGAAAYAAQHGLANSSGTIPSGMNVNNQNLWETWAETVQQPGAGAYSSYWAGKLGQAQQLISQYG